MLQKEREGNFLLYIKLKRVYYQVKFSQTHPAHIPEIQLTLNYSCNVIRRQ